jgi:hypothetical protein
MHNQKVKNDKGNDSVVAESKSKNKEENLLRLRYSTLVNCA